MGSKPTARRANNSVVLMRHLITRDFFDNIWERVKASGSGEPGFYFTNDKDWELTHAVKLRYGHTSFVI